MKELELKIYEYLRTIPKGKVVTYGKIAKYFGKGIAIQKQRLINDGVEVIELYC